MVQLVGDLYGVNRELLRRALNAARAQGIAIRINSGYRSTAEQQRLYDRYLSGEGPLAAKPGTSWHEFRGALDAKWMDGVPLRDRRSVVESQGLAFTVASESWHIQRNDMSDRQKSFNLPYWKGLDRFPATLDSTFPLADGDFFGYDYSDPEVWNGSEGASTWHRVWAIQRAVGLPFGDRNGIFGVQTRDAVIAFQKNRGLPAQGLVGARTWAELRV